MKLFSNSGKNYLLIVVSLLVNLSVTSQNIDITGKISDKKTGEPLFANIQIKDCGIGTISGENGYFRLKIPAKYISKKILFSCIGYETQEILIKNIDKNIKIYLNPVDYQIGEVVIMPDSTLLTLLAKAYKKISENYPTYPTKLKGFFRESVKSTCNKYLYFAEAVTETYKSSYNISSDYGQVKILKSLVNEFPDLGSLKVRFYGGVFMGNESDIIKKNVDFINPKHFNKYNYSLAGLTEISGNKAYIITFDTKNDSLKGTKNGKLYLETTSLAYIGCEYESTKRGIDNFNDRILEHFRTEQFKKTVNYIKFNNKWHLKYVSTKEIFSDKVTNAAYELNAEYIANEIITDSVKPIPFGERLEYGDIFSEKAKSYHSDDYWEEYNVLKKDSLLDNQIKLLFDTVASKRLLTQKTPYTKKNNRIKIISNFSMGYGLTYYPLHSPKGNYSISYVNNENVVNLSEEFGSLEYNINILMHIGYDLNHRWSFNFNYIGSIGKKLSIKTYDIGTSYRLLIKKRGKPAFFNIGLFCSYNSFARNFSNYQNDSEFELAGKTFDANKLQFGIGYTTFGLKPQINFEYQLKRRLYLHAIANYYIALNTKEKLFLEEKSGFFLMRQKGNISLMDNSLEITHNESSTNKSELNFENYSLSIGFMLKF